MDVKVNVHAAAQRGYSKEAGAYESGRPEYPEALAGWLTGPLGLGAHQTVVDVGAGTGKFTRRLVATGAEVIAVEPVDAMRAQITGRLGQVRALAGTAQVLPLPDASADVIVCAQAFHWFASTEVLEEFRRVLKPGGRLGLVWNVRDESVDWVAALTAIVQPHEGDAPRFYKGDWRRPFPHAGFSALQETRLPHVHSGPAQQVIVDRLMSVSFIAALPETANQQVRQQLEALAASHPALREQERIDFPYQTLAFHCTRL